MYSLRRPLSGPSDVYVGLQTDPSTETHRETKTGDEQKRQGRERQREREREQTRNQDRQDRDRQETKTPYLRQTVSACKAAQHGIAASQRRTRRAAAPSAAHIKANCADQKLKTPWLNH